MSDSTSKSQESINVVLHKINKARTWLLEHVKEYAFTRDWHPYNDVRWHELAELCAAYSEHTDSEELKEARRLISEYIDTINSFDAMGSVAARDRLRAFMKGKPVRNHRAEELERECEKLKKMVITARGMFKILNYLQNHRYQSIDEFIAETEKITLKDSSEQCQCWNYMSDGCDLHGNKPPVQQTAAKDEEIRELTLAKNTWSETAENYKMLLDTKERELKEAINLYSEGINKCGHVERERDGLLKERSELLKERSEIREMLWKLLHHIKMN